MSQRQKPPQEVEWNFFSFPVAYGFAVGGFIALIWAAFIPFNILFTVFLFAVSFGTAHLLAHTFRKRSLARRREMEEEEERERRALAARAANTQAGEAASKRRRRRRIQG